MKLRVIMALTMLMIVWKQGSAQVEGLSYEIGGLAEYIFFDDEVGIEDGMFLGGEFGFGLGRLIELRGTYQQGINLQRDFSGLNENFTGLAERDVDIRHYGGEIQVNLLKTAIKPYVTFGAGVQDIEAEGLDESSALYVRGGLGVLLTANDRFAWNLFGNVHSFNANPYSSLMSDAERNAFNIDLATRDFDETVNFSLGTKFTFYLGGRDPDKQTALDRALRRSFQSGLRGVTFEFEPTYSWLDFDDDLPFANGQAIGAKLGVDLGPYFGVRGFFHRGMEDGEFLEFEELNMYGGELVFNLNEPSGIVPFIVLGGGFLDIGDDYVGRDDVDAVLEDKGFAMGGLGLRVPLADVFLLKGSARTLIMTNDEIENVVSTQDVTTSWVYQVGVEFKLGKKAKKPDVIEMSAYDKALYELERQAEAERTALAADSEAEIARLSAEIKRLREEGGKKEEIERNLRLIREAQERANTEDDNTQPAEASTRRRTVAADQIVIPQLEDGEVYIRFGEANNTLTNNGTVNGTVQEEVTVTRRSSEVQETTEVMSPRTDTVYVQPDGIVLKPEELKEMLRSVAGQRSMTTMIDTTGLPEAQRRGLRELQLQEDHNELRVQNRMLELELDQMKKNAKQTERDYDRRLKRELESERMRIERKQLEKELRESKRALNDMENGVGAETKSNPSNAVDQMADTDAASMKKVVNDSTGKFLNYKHASAMAVIGLGEANGVGLGFRVHYGVPNSNIDIVPQVYYGLIGQRQYGFDINAQMPVMTERFERFKPYVGLGAGLAGLEDDNDVVDNTGTINLILGTNFYTRHGHFYFDYTNRNFFNMNQLSAGYVFNF